jgi:hypothetical protein
MDPAQFCSEGCSTDRTWQFLCDELAVAVSSIKGMKIQASIRVLRVVGVILLLCGLQLSGQQTVSGAEAEAKAATYIPFDPRAPTAPALSPLTRREQSRDTTKTQSAKGALLLQLVSISNALYHTDLPSYPQLRQLDSKAASHNQQVYEEAAESDCKANMWLFKPNSVRSGKILPPVRSQTKRRYS